MASDFWTWHVEESVEALLKAQYVAELGAIDPTMVNIIPDFEMQPRHDGDVEESQPPQSKNGVWFRCAPVEDIGQINGICTRFRHELQMLVWTLANQNVNGEINPLSDGRIFHEKSMRAIQKILEDSNTGLVPNGDTNGVYWCRMASIDAVPAREGWTQVVMSIMKFEIRQQTLTGRGA